MTTPAISRACTADAPLAAAIIGDAFADLRVAEFLVPDDQQRRSILTRFMTIWTEHATRHGSVDLLHDETGVAVWLPSNGPAGELPTNYDVRLQDACKPWATPFRLLDRLFASRRPEAPHDHLAFLAIRPERQGRGLGTALLTHHHNAFPDQPKYLEASSPGSRHLYQRHGYHDCNRVIEIPNGARLWPMWRPVTAEHE